MVDPARVHLWAWDARPFPAFPSQSGVWGDALNWRTGHWLNGRLESVSLDRLVTALAGDVASVDAAALDGIVEGYVLDRKMSPRAAIEPLASLFGFDVAVRRGEVVCAMRDARLRVDLSGDDLVPHKDGSLIQRVRAQESELPSELAVTFWDGERDYRTATALSRRLEGASRRQTQTDLSIVLLREQAQRLADIALEDTWIARESASFSVRPGLLTLEIGDSVTLPVDGGQALYRIERITDGDARAIEARAFEPAIYERLPFATIPEAVAPPSMSGPPHIAVLDLAIVRGEASVLQYVAATADPWPGPLAIWRAAGPNSFDFFRTIDQRAIMGRTTSALGSGPAGRIDHANSVTIELASGALSSVSETSMLSGKNVAAISDDGASWEIFGFAQAELIAPRTWRLSRLLRGLGGEEQLAHRSLASGATFVLLDSAVVPLASDLALLGSTHRYRIGPADRDHADPAYVEVMATVGPKALSPYAPVRPQAVRSTAGITIAFLRRGRRASDVWDVNEIPLGEDREEYLVEILNAGLAVRSWRTGTQSVLYAASDELTDFGAAQTSLQLRIRQVSPLVGAGFPLSATVAIR